jgi:formylmethanofuran dehydrogenase subunit C
MSVRWTLDLRQPLEEDLNASALVKELLLQSKPEDAARLKLRSTTSNHEATLGDLFRIEHRTSENQTAQVTFRGDMQRFCGLGTRHQHGTILIEGNVGCWVGSEMSGGEVIVRGKAGDGLGAGLRGGAIRVFGDAGCGVGSATGTNHLGMRDGWIIVEGDVGDMAAHRQRGGVIVIEGDSGMAAASQMFAGTLIVAGTMGSVAAYGMRRGTIITADDPIGSDDRFTLPQTWRSPWFTLFFKTIRQQFDLHSPTCQLVSQLESGMIQRRRGDLSVSGQGEIFSFS